MGQHKSPVPDSQSYKHNESQSEIIKACIEVYWTIFQVFTECQPYVLVQGISLIQSEGQPPLYLMHTDLGINPCEQVTPGLNAFPVNTPPVIRAACLNLLLCDFSLQALLRPVAEKLRELGARVEWLHVKPLPRILIAFDCTEGCVTDHSVLGVTMSSGEQYIADFTGAQFGYEPEHWFMRQQEYLERYAEDGVWRADEDDAAMFDEVARTSWPMLCGVDGKVWLESVSELAYGVEWGDLDGLEWGKRIEIVRKEARNSFEGLWVERTWREGMT